MSVRQVAVLRRDIDAFEKSYQALLKTLKSWVNHVEQPWCGSQIHTENSTNPVTHTDPVTHTPDEIRTVAPQVRQIMDETDAAELATCVTFELPDHQIEAKCDAVEVAAYVIATSGMETDTLTRTISVQACRSSEMWQARAQQLWRESPVDPTKQARGLKLDEIWNDMYRAYEDEADRRLLEFVPPTTPSIFSRASELGFITPMRKCFCQCPWPVAHPHAHGKIAWDCIGCFLLTCDLITIPITLAWGISVWDAGGILLIHFLVSLTYWPLDLVVCLNTGYYREDRIIEGRLNIFVNYFRTWFLFDVLLIFIDYFTSYVMPRQPTFGALRNLRLVRLVRLLRVVKLSKVGSTVTGAFAAKGNHRLTAWAAMVKVVVLNVICTTHILACIWFYIGRSSQANGQPSWLDNPRVSKSIFSWQYLMSAHWILAQITPAGNPINPENQIEQAFAIFVILFSLFIFGGSLAKMRATLDVISKQQSERSSKRRQLITYLRNCNVSVELSARILSFAESQLRQIGSAIEPPAGLVSKTLMDELLLSLRKPTLVHHPLLLIIDNPLCQQGFVIKRLCSEGFVAHLYASQDSVFMQGAVARWWVFARVGTYQLQQLDRTECMNFNDPCWFAEVCLFVRHAHSSTLSATSVAEAFTITRDDLLLCIKSSPIVAVSFADYGRGLLKFISNQVFQTRAAVPDYLSPEISKQACKGVHVELLDLKLDGKRGGRRKSEWEKTRVEALDAVDLEKNLLDVKEVFHSVVADAAVSGKVDRRIQQVFPELADGKSLFSHLNHLDERDCVIAAISSALLFMNDQYNTFVRGQDSSNQLTLDQWSRFMDILEWASIDSKTLDAICVFLMLRGLVKSKRFAQMCAPNARASREEMMRHCLADTGLHMHLPSIERLNQEQVSLIHGMCEMCNAFNLLQFLQGENVPGSIVKLQELLAIEAQRSPQPPGHHCREDSPTSWVEIVNSADVFRAYVFAQVCVMCGLSGNECTLGSTFMTSIKAVPVLIGVRHLQDIDHLSARVIYSLYLIERSNFVGLELVEIENLALARLVCLSRITDREGLEPLHKAWQDLSKEDKAVLTDHFTGDGIECFAIILLFLPLYLSNAGRNQVVGTTRALRILVEILNILHMHGLQASDARTVEVDIQSFANYAESVHCGSAFEDAVDYIKIKKADRHILVVDDKSTSLDMREQVALIHRTVRQLARATLK